MRFVQVTFNNNEHTSFLHNTRANCTNAAKQSRQGPFPVILSRGRIADFARPSVRPIVASYSSGS